MFLRKLTVMVAPLLLAAGLCLLFPVMGGLGFWSNVLKGLLMGVVLALVVTYQYLESIGTVNWPVLSMLTTRDGQVVLVECAFTGYMAAQCIRTKK